MSSRNLLGFGSTRSAGGAAVVPVTVDTNPHNASASWIEQSGSSDAADSRRPAMLKRQTAQPGRIVGKPPPLHLSAAAEGGSSAGASPASVGSVRSLPRLGLSRFRAVAQAVIASRKKPSKVHRKQLRKVSTCGDRHSFSAAIMTMRYTASRPIRTSTASCMKNARLHTSGSASTMPS